ncbi:MAG TPA: LamG-like jellyroll fold domain-containing protein, partial [Gemmataceae bacterium]|nr:LamG-like jellyroll fold domain-containing protein [Gemmataceae bacterium]
ESEGICWIGGMGGRWGGGEGFRVYVEDGMWKMLGLSQGSDVNGEAVVCRFANGIDRTKLRQSEVEWLPASGPLKLLDVKDGFCVLTGIEGNIRSSKQRFELTVKDGAWWLDGNDEHASEPGHLVVHALRVSLTGKQPALVSSKERIVRKGPASPPKPPPAIDIVPKTDALTVQERSWHYGMPRCQTLMRGGDGIALFGGSTGGIGGAGEYVAVCANKAGDWIFEGSTLVNVTAYACCLTGLPAGFFDPEKTTTAAFERDWMDSDRAPLELCSEDEGICWIGGIGGHFGSGDGVRVRREGGKWRFACSITGHSNCTGDAVVCRFGKGVDREKLRLDEVEWSPANGPLKLLAVKDGFCALTEIHGSLESVKRAVQLTVKDGAWWLDGKDEPKKLRIRALRVSLTGNLPKLSDREPMVAKTGKPADVAILKKNVGKPDRLPVPDATAQAVALRKLRGLVKTPGAKATAKEWTNHTTFVFGLGKETKDDLNLRYVALREAFELSYPLGDPETAERAMAMLDEDYAIDSLGLKAAALSRAYAKPPVPSSHRILAERCDDVAREALAAEDFDRAGKVAFLGVNNAALTKIPAISAHAARRQNQVRELAKAFKAYTTAATELRTKPDDPKACVTAGSFLALGEGNWDAGLKLLAKGDDETLQALAKKDLSQPTDVNARRSLFEAWAKVAERQQPGYKGQAAVRASYWHRLLDGAIGGIGGIDRLKLDKRLGEIVKYLPAPLPTARWTFDGNARDVLGDLHGRNAAKLKFVEGQLRLTNRQDLLITLPFDLRERTLEAWVYFPTPERRGGIIHIRKIVDSVNGWDGIVFSVNTGRLYPGSDHEHRSRELDIPLETSQPSDLLHLAIVYASDSTVTMYRNGKLLGQPFRNDLSKPESHLRTYRKGESEIRIGGEMALDVEEARLYTRALSADEIAMSYLTFKK